MTLHAALRGIALVNEQFGCPALDVSEEEGIRSSRCRFLQRDKGHGESWWLHKHHSEVCESQSREKVNPVLPQQTTTQHRRYQATSRSTWTKENSTTKPYGHAEIHMTR